MPALGRNARTSVYFNWLPAVGVDKNLDFDPRAVVFHHPSRTNWAAVRRHWVDDAPDTLRVRLRYARWLQTPFLARRRSIFLWGALAVAAWATVRTFEHPQTRALYWRTLPAVYLTKLAWCWGAFRYFPQS